MFKYSVSVEKIRAGNGLKHILLTMISYAFPFRKITGVKFYVGELESGFGQIRNQVFGKIFENRFR